MSKTNKELAVELYGQFLVAIGASSANPNNKAVTKFPTLDEQAKQVEKLALLLAKIEDE